MRRIRFEVIATGAILIVAWVVIPFAASWWFYSATGAVAPWGDRVSMVFPAAPTAVIGLVVTGARWTRKRRATTTETLTALAVVGSLAAAVFKGAFGGIDEFTMGLCLALFVPWWFLGHVIGVVTQK